MNYKGYIGFVVLFFGLLAQAQKVTATVDSLKKKIGSEFEIALKTEVRQKDKVVFPKGKTFGSLEVLASYPVDTIKKNDRWELIKKYGVTQFDSGTYTLPKLPVKINQNMVYSNPLQIEVANVKVDTLKQKMYDIKSITPSENHFSIPWFWLSLVLLFIALLAIYIGLRKKSNREEKTIPLTPLKPIEKAAQLLMDLDAQSLVERGEIKYFYSQLTTIVRTYIEEEIEFPAMERTTSELIHTLQEVVQQKRLQLSAATLQNLERVLRQADLVKFAKEQPMLSEVEADKTQIANAIVTIHEALPEPSEVTNELDAWNTHQRELARQKQEKKRREQRILYGSLIGIGCFALIMGVVISIFGYQNVKDVVLGNPTRELYEGTWVKSEYGDPNVELETPEVLTRVENEQLPKNTYAVIKAMRMFTSGSLHDPLYVNVATNYYKSQAAKPDTTAPQIDYDKVLEGITKSWEAEGARNILYKSDGEFEIADGIKGTRVHGSMTVENKENGATHRRYYEIILFNQNGGLQQVAVSFEEGDPYGKKILRRILSSIKLQIFNLNG